MKVFIDGKEVECQESVKVIHTDEIVNTDGTCEEMLGEVHIQCTNEGIIVDCVNEEGEVIKSAWQDIDDLIEMTH